jgi:hypothetical protein
MKLRVVAAVMKETVALHWVLQSEGLPVVVKWRFWGL